MSKPNEDCESCFGRGYWLDDDGLIECCECTRNVIPVFCPGPDDHPEDDHLEQQHKEAEYDRAVSELNDLCMKLTNWRRDYSECMSALVKVTVSRAILGIEEAIGRAKAES
jgi:hypothetical protein